jgi:putative transposase
VPKNLKRYYGRGDEHFVTFSCYRRLPLLARRERRDLFLEVLEAVRRKYEMVVVGYVLMHEHVHLLLEEPRKGNLSVALKVLKQGVSRRVLKGLGRGDLFVGGVRLHHFWQARFHDFNVWSPKKHVEKLRYIHRNPVTRGLVNRPELWRWSSFRHYAYGERGLVAVNERFPSDLGLRGREGKG